MNLKLIVAAALFAIGYSSSAQAQLNFQTNTGTNSASAVSGLGGVQAGYNWQRDWLVFGLEADISGMRLNPQFNTVLQGTIPIIAPLVGSASSSIDWYGTVRGLAGWSSGPVLAYATGGLAYGRVDLSSSFSATVLVPGLTLAAQTSAERAGWVIGGGIGYLSSPNVMLNLEYQYVDLGSVNLASSAASNVGPSQISQSASANGRFQVVTAGISWLFTPTSNMPGAPWQGGYVGGHVGAAWGNDTTASYSASVAPPSDIRLKRDIALVGRLGDGLGLYRYRYLWSDTVYVGVMAQEVALLHPDAIVRSELDDYLRVDYGRLGLKLMTLAEWEREQQN